MAVQLRQASLPEMIASIKHDNTYSGDINVLERLFSYTPVFVYGTTQRNYSDDHVMEGFPRLGFGVTEKDSYQMETCNNEPVIFDNGRVGQRQPIFGELYIVPNRIIWKLDGLLCRGVHFSRRMEPVIYQAVRGPGQALFKAYAWIYVGMHDKWVTKYLKPSKIFFDEKFPVNWYYRFTIGDDKPNRDEINDATTRSVICL